MVSARYEKTEIIPCVFSISILSEVRGLGRCRQEYFRTAAHTGNYSHAFVSRKKMVSQGSFVCNRVKSWITGN